MAAELFLKPIRDLSRNWDIDIASCLEDYLEDLSSIKITLDGGGSSLNFAEAALLIQGTSAVYAKKVEYLYTLVFKVLEVITDKKKNPDGDEKKDSDLDTSLQFDVELNFLLLDDLIETGAKINLMEEDVDAIGDYEAIEFGRAGTNKRRMSTTSNRRLSHASAISKGSAALNASLVADIGSSGLRLMSSDVNASGALLLPGSNAFNDEGSEGGFDVDADDDMSTGFDLDGDQFTNESNSVNRSTYNEANVSGVSDSLALAIPNANSSYGSSNQSQMSEAAANDPWRLVDPHRALSSKNKPLKKGKTFTIPSGIGEDGTIDESVETSLNVSTSINRSSFVVEDENLKLKGLAYGQEFAYVAKEIKKKKAAKKRRSKKANNWYGSKKKKQTIADLVESEEEQDYDDNFGAGDEGDFEASFQGGGPQQNVDDERFNKMFGGAKGVEEEEDDEKYYNRNAMDETRFEEKFESLCKAHLRAFAAGAERYAAESQLTKRVADWSFKLQPTLQSEEKRTAFDIHETGKTILNGMSSNVSAQKAEGKKFKGSNPNVVDFHAVTNGMKQFEVCRVFLASLMLANAGNITLSHPDMDGSGVADNINMELHGTNLDKPMDTYMAPSAVEQRPMEEVENSQEPVGAA